MSEAKLDERLMAYVDGELAPDERVDVERALAADPALATRVARERALRARIDAAFAPELEEPVPERLRRAALPPTVVDLSVSRARRRWPLARDRDAASWGVWGGIAASLVVGVIIGRLMPMVGERAPTADASLVASGAIADALEHARAADAS